MRSQKQNKVWCVVAKTAMCERAHRGAQIEALRTVIVFTVVVGVAKTINFSYTLTLSTCPIYVGPRPTVLGSSFCITIL